MGFLIGDWRREVYALLRLYYEWSPGIVQMMEEDEEFREEVKEMIDGILLELNLSKLIEDT